MTIYLLNIVIFHSYVESPESNFRINMAGASPTDLANISGLIWEFHGIPATHSTFFSPFVESKNLFVDYPSGNQMFFPFIDVFSHINIYNIPINIPCLYIHMQWNVPQLSILFSHLNAHFFRGIV